MSAFIQYTLQGLAAGGFYALSALGLAVIFGVLGVVNFSHGACYMLGAVISAVLLAELGIGFWAALVVVPIVMFGFGVLMERLFVRWLLALDPLYNFLLTFGLTLIIVEAVKQRYGVSGLPYEIPAGLGGQVTVGSVNLSVYAIFACVFSVVVCLAVGLLMTRTRIGMIVRASTENADRTRAFGINVTRWVTPVFGFGIALAGLAGGVFAISHGFASLQELSWTTSGKVVLITVLGGIGTLLGAVVAGFLVGLVEAYGVAYAPAYAQIVIFVLMAAVILVRPSGLFGREEVA